MQKIVDKHAGLLVIVVMAVVVYGCLTYLYARRIPGAVEAVQACLTIPQAIPWQVASANAIMAVSLTLTLIIFLIGINGLVVMVLELRRKDSDEKAS